jgi:hypothetical protein
MLSPARLTQFMMEVIFILLGGLVMWLGAIGRINFDRRSVAILALSIALIGWGLLAFARPVRQWAIWEKWNRGVSLILIGIILLAMTRVPFLWVPRLLILVGLVLVTRGLYASLMIFKQY